MLNDKLPNDVRWARESIEYKALCHQVYNHAIEKLRKKMKKTLFQQVGLAVQAKVLNVYMLT